MYVTPFTSSVLWYPTCLSYVWVNFVDFAQRAWLQRVFECCSGPLIAGSLDESGQGLCFCRSVLCQRTWNWFVRTESIKYTRKEWEYISRIYSNIMLQVLLDWKGTCEKAALSCKNQSRTLCLHVTFPCMKDILYSKLSFVIIFFRIVRVNIVLYLFSLCFYAFIFVGNCMPWNVP